MVTVEEVTQVLACVLQAHTNRQSLGTIRHLQRIVDGGLDLRIPVARDGDEDLIFRPGRWRLRWVGHVPRGFKAPGELMIIFALAFGIRIIGLPPAVARGGAADVSSEQQIIGSLQPGDDLQVLTDCRKHLQVALSAEIGDVEVIVQEDDPPRIEDLGDLLRAPVDRHGTRSKAVREFFRIVGVDPAILDGDVEHIGHVALALVRVNRASADPGAAATPAVQIDLVL